MGRLDNKVCVITGTGGSMGRASALAFAGEGALIVGCDVVADRAEETVVSVREAGGQMVSMHPCDLTKMEECEALVALALSTYGRIDVLFNNAAMAYFGWVNEMPLEDWHRTIDQEINLVYYLTRAAWPALVATGGTIVNTASISAHQAYRPLPGLAHMAAKGAILSMTRQLAMEGAPHGIRANTISPGLILTHQTKDILGDDQFASVMTDQIMLKRPGRPEEIALSALFLASEESSFITGADLRVDGGTTAW
ncbi:oxidoreductase [Sphingopyxis lindanitolerans]|uniref:Oxidoreductase n=1 Tax=Sphingopyxis lindanitolerans TaxID=2054227 RepID=A0A2S8B0X3_9SPHN|nr:SDR family oxidoreductase [Sphingopyxis lindanitolerans]PQM26032.1 oxidoreductase [Sphingopyxis lindanitolerans]